MISVIIPTLNEEKHIAKCIDALQGNNVACEVIVADGGSIDRTKEITSGYSRAYVTESDKGRGTQMNAGGAVATGDILLFLHADTILEQGWAEELCTSLNDPSVVGGAFRFCIDNPSSQYRLVEAWVRLRCRIFNLPYGDQAIFIRKSAFQTLSGYKEIPLMEDVEIISRLKKLGTIAILRKKAFTSGRRWVSKGLLKTAAINQMTMLMYHLGVSPERLARFYYR